MVKIETIEDLHKYLNILPLGVLKDINKRITDWLSDGGILEDGYIKQQFRYAENVINLKRLEG